MTTGFHVLERAAPSFQGLNDDRFLGRDGYFRIGASAENAVFPTLDMAKAAALVARNRRPGASYAFPRA